MNVLISCDVGGDLVPAQFTAAQGHQPATEPACEQASLPGRLPATLPCDESAKYVAAQMADRLNSPLIANDYALDLIDVTRSLRHRQLFPPLTRDWPTEARQQLVDLIYQPYRRRLLRAIRTMLFETSSLIHLSVRTFELRSKGRIRRADMGLLYDPAIDREVDLCLDWIDEMYERLPMLRVRRNYPRSGTADSTTKAMRHEFSGQNYIGIEVLLNRAWANRAVAARDEVIGGICRTLQAIIGTRHSAAA